MGLYGLYRRDGVLAGMGGLVRLVHGVGGHGRTWAGLYMV